MITRQKLNKDIIAGMEPWLENIGTATRPANRSAVQRAWDSAVLAAAEYVRRRTGDETLAGEVHQLLVKCLSDKKQ